jgi:SAM-dependent methyltransferase
MDSTRSGAQNAEQSPSPGPVKIDWSSNGEKVVALCPICGDTTAKLRLLTATSTLCSVRAVVRCAGCEAVFSPDLPAWPYNDFPPEFVQLYVEQGASIDLMVQPLFLVPGSSVRNYLEVGCGFGFGVDFATHSLGWKAIGLEPSQLGVVGRELLGIDLRAEYLREDTAFSELNDLVFSSEVLEHVPEPKPFLRAAARALAPHGVLILTTPNAARLKPDAAPFAQLSILSFPFHVILYARATLERILAEVGLPFVHVIERDDTLIAMASAQPLAPLDASLDPANYRAYLWRRVEQLTPGTTVANGMAYRLFKECMNCADYSGAERSLERLRQEVTLRFGAELGRLTPLPGGYDGHTLADFAKVRPFNLCGCYYFQGMLALNHQGDPQRAAHFFDAAQRAGTDLRRLLWTIGVDDGETEDLVNQSIRHARLARSRVDEAAAAAAQSLESAPAPAAVAATVFEADEAAAAQSLESAPAPAAVAAIAFEADEGVAGQSLEPAPASPAMVEAEAPALPQPEPLPAWVPFAAPASDQAHGYLDEVTPNGVASGWAFDPAAPSKELTIDFCIDGEVAKTTRADCFRTDLAVRKIGNGCHGFSEDLSSWLVEDRNYVISVHIGGVELSPGPIVVHGKARAAKRTARSTVDPKRFLHVEHDPKSVASLARSTRRLAIVVFYHAQGRVFAYHRRLLQDLKSQGFATVIVRNGSENLSRFIETTRDLADLVLVRENAGLDFSAWLSAFALLGLEPSALRELVFANDSVVGPLFPLREAVSRMAAADCDFWGMTDSWEQAYHLQSYFLCFKEAALRSAALSEYLRDYAHPTEKDEIIAQGEVALTQALLAANLRAAAYCPYLEVAEQWLLDLPRRVAEFTLAPEALTNTKPQDGLRGVLHHRSNYYATIAGFLRSGQPLNSSHFFWDTLIRAFRFPFLKKDLLLRNPASIPNVGDVHPLIAERTEFPLQELLEVFLHSPGALAPPLPLVVDVPRPHVEARTERHDTERRDALS